MKSSKKMQRAILRVVKPWTNDLAECDGRNLNGVAITLTYDNEMTKDAPRGFWDFCRIEVQDVAWNGKRDRGCRDIYYVTHAGEINVMLYGRC